MATAIATTPPLLRLPLNSARQAFQRPVGKSRSVHQLLAPCLNRPCRTASRQYAISHPHELRVAADTPKDTLSDSGVPSVHGRPVRTQSGRHGSEGSPVAMPLDMHYLGTNFVLPGPDEYPHADAHLFTPGRVKDLFQSASARRGAPLQYQMTLKGQRTNVPADILVHHPLGIYVYELSIQVPGLWQETAIGEGISKKSARVAAWTHVLAKVHATQKLGTLLPSPEPYQVYDVKFLLPRIPVQSQYPHISSALFEPTSADAAFQTGFDNLTIAADIEWHHEVVHHPGLRETEYTTGLNSCQLTLDLPDTLRETVKGEGRSKILAKRAAWVHMVVRLHETEQLLKIFPPPSQDGSVAEHDAEHEADEVEREGADLLADEMPRDLDARTMAAEKDAQMEVFNFSASVGFVPIFTATVVEPTVRKGRQGRMQRKATPFVRVSIEIEQAGISVSGVGKNLATAEIVAALSFKSAVEKLGSLATDPTSHFAALDVETAIPFLDFYRSVRPHTRLEKEYEQIMVAGSQRNSITLRINGRTMGTGVMQTRRAAEVVAYLGAAVEILQDEPQLSRQFTEALRKGGGNILQRPDPIKATFDFPSVELMRRGLIEAREAGLSDSRKSLLINSAPPAEKDKTRTKLDQRQRKALSLELLKELQSSRADPRLFKVREMKAILPVTRQKSQILNMVSGNTYSTLLAATGSGKTTQIPQFLLEDAIERELGGFCNIVCTQPRRIAARSVAQRVATERGEPLQRSVGYHVRYDAKLPRQGGAITYCTTGVLLAKLKLSPHSLLEDVSHLILDEAHERDKTFDFLLVVLKKALQARLERGKSVPKIVFMSATLDPKLFADYFVERKGGRSIITPTLTVPGRSFKVTERYLFEILEEIANLNNSEIDGFIKADAVCQEYVGLEQALTKPSASDQEPAGPAIDWKRRSSLTLDDEETASTRIEREEAIVPVPLLAATIAHICKTQENGAILVFLPGVQEIVQTEQLLLQHRLLGLDFGNPDRFRILPLHAMLSAEEQQRIFDEVPAGCRKVILSTNIAETSVTVSDVRFVVDTGKLREQRYDHVKRVSKLQCVWESSSNAKQRMGRAGRVHEGFYYALFSRERRETLRTLGVPELLRTDLSETVLSVKAQGFDEPVSSFLRQAIEPPSESAVAAAIESLKAMEAFSPDEKLTVLGRVLALLPVHPKVGKMIIMGIVFRCLDPMIVLGAMEGERRLFVVPASDREAARASRANYGQTQHSDHLAGLEAFNELRQLRRTAGQATAQRHAKERYLHFGAFSSIDSASHQIELILAEAGLVPLADVQSAGRQYGGATLNTNTHKCELIKALILAGVSPNIAIRKQRAPIMHRSASHDRIVQSPGSQNRTKSKDAQPGALYAYSKLTKSRNDSSLLMHDTTLVTPVAAMLFGGKLGMEAGKTIELGEWLPFAIQGSGVGYAAKMILEFRKALDRMLNNAFHSLADQDGHSSLVADDPARTAFIRRLIELLDHAAGL